MFSSPNQNPSTLETVPFQGMYPICNASPVREGLVLPLQAPGSSSQNLLCMVGDCRISREEGAPCVLPGQQEGWAWKSQRSFGGLSLTNWTFSGAILKLLRFCSTLNSVLFASAVGHWAYPDAHNGKDFSFMCETKNHTTATIPSSRGMSAIRQSL